MTTGHKYVIYCSDGNTIQKKKARLFTLSEIRNILGGEGIVCLYRVDDGFIFRRTEPDVDIPNHKYPQHKGTVLWASLMLSKYFYEY